MTRTASLYMGDVPVTVEFDYEPEERQTHDHPGYPESASIVDVRIGDKSVGDLESIFSDWQLQKWETEILEARAESLQSQKDEYEIERYIDRQQRLLEPTFY